MDASANSEISGGKQPKRRTLRYWILGALIIAAMGTGLRFAKPVFHWVRARQAASLAREAYPHIEAENWKAAADLLREAYQTSSREPEVMRALARFYSFADLRRQRRLLADLHATGRHNAEDLRDMIGLELGFRDLGKAQQLTSELLKNHAETKENLEIAVEVARAAGDLSLMERQLEKSLALEPGDTKAQFNLALILIRSSFEEKSRSGWERIYELAKAPDETGLSALRLIVRQEPYFPGRITEIHDLMRKHPDATEKDFVAALDWHYKTAPLESEKAALLEGAVRERAGRPHAENRDLYFWLNSIGEQQRVLSLLPKEEAFASPNLLAVYVTSLIQDKQFGEVRKILELEDELESSSEVSFIKAQCAIYLDLGTAQVREQLQEAYELALLDKRTQMLSHVAELANNRGMQDFARTVYESMANIPETSLIAYDNLMQLAKRRKDLPAMRSIGREIREKMPDNPSVVKLAVYLDLLYGADLEAAFETVRALSEDLPADDECTMILAFAHYRMGDLKRATELARGCNLAELPPSYRAVYAAIRGASGDSLEAVSLVEKLPQSLLLEEELDLVRPWILRL